MLSAVQLAQFPPLGDFQQHSHIQYLYTVFPLSLPWASRTKTKYLIYLIYVHLLDFTSVLESAVFCCHLSFSLLLCSV